MTKLLVSLLTGTVGLSFGAGSIVSTMNHNTNSSNQIIKNLKANDYQIVLGQTDYNFEYEKITNKGVEKMFTQGFGINVLQFKILNNYIYQIQENTITKTNTIQKISLDGQEKTKIADLDNNLIFADIDVFGNNIYLTAIDQNDMKYKLYSIVDDQFNLVSTIDVISNSLMVRTNLINYNDQLYLNIDTGIGSWDGTPTLYKFDFNTLKFVKVIQVLTGDAIGTEENGSYIQYNQKLYIAYRSGLYEYDLEGEKPSVKKVFNGYIDNLIKTQKGIQFTDSVGALQGTAIVSYEDGIFGNYYVFEDELIDSLISIQGLTYAHKFLQKEVLELDKYSTPPLSIGELDFDEVISYQNI